jgi:hypothetical protein
VGTQEAEKPAPVLTRLSAVFAILIAYFINYSTATGVWLDLAGRLTISDVRGLSGEQKTGEKEGGGGNVLLTLDRNS